MTWRVRVHQEPDGWVAVALRDGLGEAIGRGASEDEAAARALDAGGLAYSRGHVSATLGRPRRPRAGETHRDYLEWLGLLGHGYEHAELVRRGSPRHLDPPRQLWSAGVVTLRLAIDLRQRMIGAGARGLLVHAAYRTAGGATDSRHKANAALDLDLMRGDADLGPDLLRAGAAIYAGGAHLAVGVGSYHPPRSTWTRRIHLDACTRTVRTTWQISGGDYVRPPAISRIAQEIERAHPST